MQTLTSKPKTGFVKFGNHTYCLGITDQMLAELNIKPETLLKLDFIVTVDKNKIVIESLLLDKEQRPSNTSIPGKAGTDQGVD